MMRLLSFFRSAAAPPPCGQPRTVRRLSPLRRAEIRSGLEKPMRVMRPGGPSRPIFVPVQSCGPP